MTSPIGGRRRLPMHGGPTFSLGHRLSRTLFAVAWLLLCRWTPAPLHRWRRRVLILFGARLAPTARVYPSTRIWYPANLTMAEHACLGPGVTCYAMDTIALDAYALASQGAFLCAGTHDVDDPNFALVTKPITIGAHAWIAAEAFVGPGVTVGAWAVLGARAVAFSDLASGMVHVGNPARVLRPRRVRESMP